jgi:hypothetical protein
MFFYLGGPADRRPVTFFQKKVEAKKKIFEEKGIT